MDNNETCKKSHEGEKLEIGRRGEDKAFYNPELEEGKFRKDGPSGLKNLVCKDKVASVIKLSLSAQVAVKKGQVNTRQSTSPERGSHQGGIANTTAMQSKCSSIRDHPVNVSQSTSHRLYSKKHRQSYSPSFHISSKERHEQRMRNCFSYHDYHHALKKIEEVCSERLNKLFLHQNKDRKEFNILLKKQEFKFFQEQVCSYRVHYERVIPTARCHRMKLPKPSFCILRKVFRKYMQSQLIKFVKRQINDRNKEKRIKERWIFEATAGYLKKCFDETSLTYSGLEMEKSNWHLHAYSEGEQQFKFLDMQSLTTEIEAIASSRELEESHTIKENDMFQPEPVIENLQSPLETNGGAEHGLSVDAPEETATVDRMSSQSNHAPTMEFSEKNGTQVAFSSPPQNERENVERSCSRFVTDEASVLDKRADSENAPPSFGEKRRCISPGDNALEGSCSRSQSPPGSDSNIHETSLRHEEPQAERLLSVNVNQMEQADIAGSKEVSSDDTSSFGQVTEQRNTIATLSTLVQPSTQLQFCDPTCQSATHPYQPSVVNTCSVSTGLDRHGALNAQQQSANQPTTSSMVEHIPESGLQSDSVTNEFSQLLMSLGNRTSSSAQVTEQQIASNSFSLTQHVTQQYGDHTCQTSAHQYQPSGWNNYSEQARLNSPRAPNVQHQTTTGSTSGQYMPESRIQSDPLTIEMSRLRNLQYLMTKRHLSEREKIISDCKMEIAECKRKFEEMSHNLEMETLHKMKDIEILHDKIRKQQILAETFQVVHKVSLGVASCNQRGAPRRTTREPNQPSGQQVSLFPSSATMYQSPQPSAQPSTNNFLRQPVMTTPQAIANTLGRPATNLTHAPSRLMGAGIAYNAPPPHLRNFVNLLQPSRGGAAGFDRQLQL
ncbi:hypothetical protein SEVIR_1G244800v4 [Setaria viridis]|uniref:Uncharacterized protein n=1 Tax=Setaria viridis TaxID=4556 RepID=A0A4U6WFD3_SETVI|nr:uncharacterized protein LOC117862826 [Setaria viridis]XP_034602250.1 uncharacterized protein LOC117862826 [Setaria viridis]XP_034602257.1 uncharacterized protein LOC117862826 [Setaria viridis]XP_034602265.1 uncharacterized protein LOC117862826 [Setaria viridis]XP_034602273.1 uncharacterized protein LOC117862826 [Setaria viridis]TKW40413.1 hypothetical protein SEVIR_1G244800v2 [Setaria viridis]